MPQILSEGIHYTRGEIMKKRVFVLLCVVFLVGTLSGCSNQDVGASCNEIVKACSDVAEEGSFDIWVSYGEDLYEESQYTDQVLLLQELM